MSEFCWDERDSAPVSLTSTKTYERDLSRNDSRWVPCPRHPPQGSRIRPLNRVTWNPSFKDYVFLPQTWRLDTRIVNVFQCFKLEFQRFGETRSQRGICVSLLLAVIVIPQNRRLLSFRFSLTGVVILVNDWGSWSWRHQPIPKERTVENGGRTKQEYCWFRNPTILLPSLLDVWLYPVPKFLK